MLKIIIFSTKDGAPYVPATPPTVSVYAADDGTAEVVDTPMTQIGITAFYSYDFLSVFGRHYVFQTTGDESLSSTERFHFGTLMQDEPDHVINKVVGGLTNTTRTFNTDLVTPVNDHWKDVLCVFLTGALAGQVKRVLSYKALNGVITLSNPFTGIPADGDQFMLVNR